MAVRTQTFHIAVCNVCGAEFDEAGDCLHWDDTPELALSQVLDVPDSHWTVLAGDTVVCPISDTAHYLARGGESPDLLRPTADAMSAAFIT
jgi:hypothetical protein